MAGKIQDWASQGSGQPNQTYELGVFYPWAYMLSNPSDTAPESADYTQFQDWFGLDSAGDFSVADLVYQASTNVGGSAYAGVLAFDPDDLISAVEDALDDMEVAVSDFGTDLIASAITIADDNADIALGESNIPDLTALYQARQDTAYNRDVANLYAGLWEGSAIVGTQTFVAAALLKNERNREVSEYEKSLELSRQSQRAQLVGQIMSTAIGIASQKMQAAQALVGTKIDYLRIVALAKQDQIDKDLEYVTRNATWDLDLMQYAQNALGSIYGAQQAPRQQTKGERLLAAVNSSISLAIQGGLALGNPGVGVALGATNLITQLLLTPR